MVLSSPIAYKMAHRLDFSNATLTRVHFVQFGWSEYQTFVYLTELRTSHRRSLNSLPKKGNARVYIQAHIINITTAEYNAQYHCNRVHQKPILSAQQNTSPLPTGWKTNVYWPTDLKYQRSSNPQPDQFNLKRESIFFWTKKKPSSLMHSHWPKFHFVNLLFSLLFLFLLRHWYVIAKCKTRGCYGGSTVSVVTARIPHKIMQYSQSIATAHHINIGFIHYNKSFLKILQSSLLFFSFYIAFGMRNHYVSLSKLNYLLHVQSAHYLSIIYHLQIYSRHFVYFTPHGHHCTFGQKVKCSCECECEAINSINANFAFPQKQMSVLSFRYCFCFSIQEKNI